MLWKGFRIPGWKVWWKKCIVIVLGEESCYWVSLCHWDLLDLFVLTCLWLLSFLIQEIKPQVYAEMLHSVLWCSGRWISQREELLADLSVVLRGECHKLLACFLVFWAAWLHCVSIYRAVWTSTEGVGRIALLLSLLLILSAFHTSVIHLIFQPFSSLKMHLFSENSPAHLQHSMANQGDLRAGGESSHAALTDLPFVLARLECVAGTIAEPEDERSTVGKCSFWCFWLFSWTLYAASEASIWAESAWKHTKSGTWPFCPPCIGMKIKLKIHREYNCFCGVLLLE